MSCAILTEAGDRILPMNMPGNEPHAGAPETLLIEHMGCIPPVAIFTTKTHTGLRVTVDPQNSYDDVEIVQYRFDFNDGSPIFVSSNDSYYMHTYSSAGTYDIHLTVVDNEGLTDTAVLDNPLQMDSSPPISSFIYTTYRGNRNVDLIDVSVDQNTPENLTAAQWDMGDGTILNKPPNDNFVYTYAADGTYTVTLTVTNSYNKSHTSFQDIQVPRLNPNIVFIHPHPVNGPFHMSGLNVDGTASTLLSSYDDKDNYVGPVLTKFYNDGLSPTDPKLITESSFQSLCALQHMSAGYDAEFYPDPDVGTVAPYFVSHIYDLEKLPSDAALAGPGMSPDAGWATDCVFVTPQHWIAGTEDVYINCYAPNAGTTIKLTGPGLNKTVTTTNNDEVKTIAGMRVLQVYSLSASDSIVTGFIRQEYARTGGFNVGPKMCADKEYYLPRPSNPYGGIEHGETPEWYVTPIENDTTVTWPNGTTETINTGTFSRYTTPSPHATPGLMVADKPVVMTMRSKLNSAATDNCANFCMPNTRCGYQYVIPGIFVTGSAGDHSHVDIVAIDGGEVKIYSQTGGLISTYNMAAGGWQKHIFNEPINYIESVGRIQVTQTNRRTSTSGDPDYCTIPPMDAAINQSGFACKFAGLINNYYMFVTIPTAKKSQLVFQNSSGTDFSSNFTWYDSTGWDSTLGENWSMGRVAVAQGGYNVRTTDGSKFLGYVFGGSLTYESVFYHLGRNWYRKYYLSE